MQARLIWFTAAQYCELRLPGVEAESKPKGRCHTTSINPAIYHLKQEIKRLTLRTLLFWIKQFRN